MKKLLSIFIAILLVGSTAQIQSMDFESEVNIEEEKKNQDQSSTYVFEMIKPFTKKNTCFIVLNDNSTKCIPLERIKPFKTLTNAIKFNQNTVIDLRSYPELESQEELQLLLDCADPQSKKTVNSLSKEDARKILQLADLLQAKDTILHLLSEKILPTLKGEEFNDLFHTMQRSIKYTLLAKKHDYPIELPKQKNNSLALDKIKLDSLDGIEQLKSKSIKTLDISHNNLEKLQLKKIILAFPSIACINANHNKISKLTKDDLEAVLEGLTLHLEHNQIDTIEIGDGINAFKAHINLKNNPLTSSALSNLYDSVKPSTMAELKNNLKKVLVFLKNPAITNSLLYNAFMIALTGKAHSLNLPEIVRIALFFMIKPEIYSLDPKFLIHKAYRLLNNTTNGTAKDVLIIMAVVNALYSQLYIPRYLDNDKIMKIINHFVDTPKKILRLIPLKDDCYSLIAEDDLLSIISWIKRQTSGLHDEDVFDKILRFDEDFEFYNRTPQVIALDFIKIAIRMTLSKKNNLRTSLSLNNSSYTKECKAAFKTLKLPVLSWNPMNLLWKYVFFCREKMPDIPYPYNLLIGALGVTLNVITNYTPSPTVHKTTHPSKIIEIDNKLSYISLKEKEGEYDKEPKSLDNPD